jgi:hypothetical protein
VEQPHTWEEKSRSTSLDQGDGPTDRTTEARTLEVRELESGQLEKWDRFVERSPQGTIFSESLWLELCGYPFRVLACYKGEEIVGGVAVFEDESRNNTMETVPLTPFQGFLFRNNSFMKPPLREKLEKKVSFALIEALERRHRNITLCHHYNFEDVRPFYFHTYGRDSQYIVTVRYTSVVDLTDMNRAWSKMEDNTHCEIHKGEKRGNSVEESDDFEIFDGIHRRTFERQGIERGIPSELLARMYAKLKNEDRCQLFLARNFDGSPTSACLAIWDDKRAYHWLAASDPDHRNDGSASLTLWAVFRRMGERFPEIDLVGCNSPKRAAFKAGFGAILKHYFVTSLFR